MYKKAILNTDEKDIYSESISLGGNIRMKCSISKEEILYLKMHYS